MKAILWLILFSLIFGIFFFYQLPTPCDKPVEYTIGHIDSRFGVNSSDFLASVREAGHAWEKASGLNLFDYNPDSKLTINLVYDERQQLTNKISDTQNTLKQDENAIKPKLEDYKKQSAQFKQDVANLNDEIQYWNIQGGASPDKFDALSKKQQELRQKANELNAMAQALNQSADSYNSEAGQLNQDISTFNEVIVGKPEEGLYDPKENLINIYYNVNHSELIHTLEHELGHAIGLDHSPVRNAIMYPRTNEAVAPTSVDITALNVLCKKKTAYDLFQRNLHILQSKFST